MKPTISVIIPVYNAEPYLQQCLQSVVDQTIFDQIEIVAVNDGSTDNSGNILKSFSNRYSNIRVITQENKGIALARQTGLKNSGGVHRLRRQ